MTNACTSRWFWIAISTIAAASAAAEPGAERAAQHLLPAHEATFEVLRKGRKAGEVHLSMIRDENGIWFYDTRTEATAFVARMLGLSAEESAHFIWRGREIVPLTYHQVARGPTRNRYWQHRFDWDAGLSETRTYEGDYEIELERGVVDPLTLRLAIAARLHDKQARDDDHTFSVLERDEIEQQQFFYQNTEALELESGCYNTVKMKRFRREGSSRNYYSWHAAEFHWMPVRILQIKDDDEHMEFRLLEWSILDGEGDRTDSVQNLNRDLCAESES